MCNKAKVDSWPDGKSPQEAAELLAKFFREKVHTIHDSLIKEAERLSPTDSNSSSDQCSRQPADDLEMFTLFTTKEMGQIIKDLPSKTCELDPIPTTLLKDCLDVLIRPITDIINMSIESGTVPTSFKQAIVRPLIKKDGLDKNCLNNYRPVSNLSFMSKVLEKAVGKRLQQHLEMYNLMEKHQSAYRIGHSTETALLKVTNDLLAQADKGNISALILLDLSAAFDTIDHSMLLSRMTEDLAIKGTALKWFQSYLSDRSQRVTVQDKTSSSQTLTRGVPQGSVLGPVLFTLYTKPLSKITMAHGVNQHQYADDNQLYLSFPVNKTTQSLDIMQKCCTDIKCWMTCNLLKLNDAKTEFMIIGPRSKLSKIDMPDTITVGDASIVPVSKVKNLGVWLDNQLRMTDQVSQIVKSANYHIRNIGKLRSYLDQSATIKLVLALVISRIDYCNSLLSNINQDQLKRLQSIQNTAARIVTKTNKFDHISPVLHKLHWLPISARIDYKVLLFAYKCFYNDAPNYITDMLPRYHPNRSLRSQDQSLFQIPRVSTASFGKRTFAYNAAIKWNNLPQEIKQCQTISSFKSSIKTYLFKKAFKTTFSKI